MDHTVICREMRAMDKKQILWWAFFAACIYLAATCNIPLLPFNPLER